MAISVTINTNHTSVV